MKSIPLCHKCADKIIQPDMLDSRCSEIVGCHKLTKREWEDGNRKGEEGFYYQHNCPIME